MHPRRASLLKLNSNWPTPQFSIKSERRVSMQIVDILAGLPAAHLDSATAWERYSETFSQVNNHCYY
jgi:hypothetical protein